MLRELDGDLEEREVLITDDRYYRMFYPSEMTADAASRKTIEHFALLTNSTGADTSAKQVHHSILDPERDIFLREHRLQGEPLLPFVVSMELLLEAALRHRLGQGTSNRPLHMGMSAFEVVRGMKFARPSALETRLLTEASQAIASK